ncbi:electron transport complex subunit RsxC [Colwellia psychrerythraea]|uniref:Ion-translocating oxidoreductase complex subunit C n=1 Tax=Colwellia psychrerythraea (strain 34H / ATCC BAA-681) TaxID=167879 RepID=Q482U5_COLP3|nr:electron transport complex subunit RsxC [Colwellia psychrerythraea]AAZ27851.1 electron transport complex, RnfABCDGE type, C subunit [Colwellia psychrerythraea 34H]
MVESVIERITRGNFWDFHGGIHPPEQKFLTSNKPIKHLALPKQLIIPLQQHIGREGDLLVSIGEHVLKGQALTLSTNPMVVPIHAPTSGTISAIKMSVIAHPSGLSQLCVFLDVDGEDTWRKRNVCEDLEQLSNHEIVKKIANAGIAGMGGAGFPTHIKVSSKPDIKFLIINGAECEPYITADDLLMMEQSNAIVDGIKILDRLLTPTVILIGIEANKPKAIKALQKATAAIEKIKVCIVPTKYPTGGEKQLVQILTGQEVKSGRLPIHDGIVMQNIATCFAINEAVRHDTPLIRRVVTVTGQALNKPQNVWALLGTPINFLLEQCSVEGIENQKQPVIMGGPMMGFSVSSELVPIVKTSNCILVPSKKEMPSAFEKESNEVECIRCGQCSDVCPSQLLPQELQWSAKAKDYSQLEKLNLRDCIDCGACAYVCPSQIPLVHYYRIAKAEIREQQQLDLKAEKAKIRFEARKLRLEKEKVARQEKHKKAAAARKAAMNKATPEATGAKSAVAAALARVKAKKASKDQSQVSTSNSQKDLPADSADDQKSQVAAAIARAKAKKKLKEEATQKQSGSDSIVDSAVEEKPASTEQVGTDDKKSKIAAAIAKAKAKKLNKSADASDSEKMTEDTSPEKTVSTDDKKTKIAAAIAKAKAKKLSKAAEVTDLEKDTKNSPPEQTAGSDDKKAKIAAAIAKAKNKAIAKANVETIIEKKVEVNETSVLTSTDNSIKTDSKPSKPEKIEQENTAESESKPVAAIDKKAKIAAAIAKAKAKKKLKEASTVEENDQDGV